MNRFRNFSLVTLLLLVSIGGAIGIRSIQRHLDSTVETEKLRFSGALSDAPPAVAFTSMALGSFRGLLADALWLRSEAMKNKKNYFEMVQLARWITDLQPNYSGGTAYLAWNLAYNISVTSSDWEERWYWVNEGIRLIRDKALLYNPDDPVLYRELAWIYFHKLGNVLDDANLYYKNQLAVQIESILGSPYPDIDMLAAAPADDRAFMTRFPAGHKLWSAAQAAGYKNLDELYAAFRSSTPAAVPEKLAVRLNEEDLEVLTAALRVKLLKERMHLDAARMQEIDRRFGQMDWRAPESIAIYWATIGVEKSNGLDVQCTRIVTQALQAAFIGGRLLGSGREAGGYIQVVPNLAVAEAAYENFIAAQESEKKAGSYGSAESFRSARINYLKSAIPVIYVYGDPKKARKFYSLLLKEDGAQKQKTFEDFLAAHFAEDVRDGDLKNQSTLISGMIYTGICKLVLENNSAEALEYERMARRMYRIYVKSNIDVKRNTLPPYSEIKAGVVDMCRRSWNPFYVEILNKAIAVEQAAAKEAKEM